jgi:hypothetical protein
MSVAMPMVVLTVMVPGAVIGVMVVMVSHRSSSVQRPIGLGPRRSRPPGFSGHEPLHAGNFRGTHVPVLAFPHPDDREGGPDGREIEVAKE